MHDLHTIGDEAQLYPDRNDPDVTLPDVLRAYLGRDTITVPA